MRERLWRGLAALRVGEQWTAGHAKELTFLQGKQRARYVEAYNDGTLLDAEITPAVVAEAATAELAARVNRDTRARDAARAAQKHRGSVFKLRAGASVFVESSVRDLDARLDAHGLIKAPRHTADVIVVPHPGKLGQRTHYAAALRGCYVVGPSLEKGPALKYKPFIATRTVFHCSLLFTF